MHRFVIHTYNRSPSDRCKWVPKECVFGHINSDICQVWVDRIQQLLERDLRRPKQLLVSGYALFLFCLSVVSSLCLTFFSFQLDVVPLLDKLGEQVIVNPYGGKRQGVEVWEQLVPLFKCAAVNTEVQSTGFWHQQYQYTSQLTMSSVGRTGSNY